MTAPTFFGRLRAEAAAVAAFGPVEVHLTEEVSGRWELYVTSFKGE